MIITTISIITIIIIQPSIILLLSLKVSLCNHYYHHKAEYFKKREMELAEREKQNAVRKAKYSAGGMKYVAMAMASRE